MKAHKCSKPSYNLVITFKASKEEWRSKEETFPENNHSSKWLKIQTWCLSQFDKLFIYFFLGALRFSISCKPQHHGVFTFFSKSWLGSYGIIVTFSFLQADLTQCTAIPLTRSSHQSEAKTGIGKEADELLTIKFFLYWLF